MEADPHGGGLPIADLNSALPSNDSPSRQLSPQSFGRAVAWTAGSQLGQQLIQLAVTIVLSRLLLPHDFGLVAMILVVSQFLVVFVDAGLGVALVHLKVIEPIHISTAIWMNIGGGILLAGAVAAASPGIAALYDQPRLTRLTAVVAVNVLIAAIGVVPFAILQRELRFRHIAGIKNIAAIVGSTAGIMAAVLGAGVWSLVVLLLVTTTLQSMLGVMAIPRMTLLKPNRNAARELWHLGAGQLGFQSLNYWSRNADNLLLGRFAGARGLGVYDRAYQLMLIPTTQAGFVVSYVLYPTLARMQDDHDRLRRAYLRTVAITGLIAFPVSVGLFVTAPDLTEALFGPNWNGVARVLRILSVAGLLQSVGTTTGVIYQSQGRTDLLFRWGLFSSVLIVGGFAIGVNWGVDGVAVAYSVTAIPMAYLNVVIPGRLIELRVLDLVRVVAGALFAAVWTGCVMYLAQDFVVDGLPLGARLAIDIALGAGVYLTTIRAMRLRAYDDAKAVLVGR